MRRSIGWLAAVPLALGMMLPSYAGIFCGGCSDPCGHGTRAARGHGCLGHHGGYGAGCGYAASSPMSYASSASCGSSYGAVSYGMQSHSCGTSYGAVSNYVEQRMTPVVEQMSVPVTTYQVTMVPTYVTETQYVATTEYQDETRYRVKKVYRSVPIEEQHYRMKTVMTPKTETKTIEYEVLIPETSEKSVDVSVSVPVWNEVTENYTIKVPTLIDVSEQYTVKVPQLRDEPFTYTVMVPTPEKVLKTQTVTNSVPVTKTRTVQRQVPKTTMRSVQKDYGHWETVVDEAAVSAIAPASNCGVVHGASNVVVMGGCGTSVSYQSIGHCGSKRHCGCGRVSGCGSCNSACGSSNGCGISSSACGVASSSACGCGSHASVSPSCATGVVSAPATRTRRVWVPNVVTEEVPVVEHETVSEEIAFTVYEQHAEQVQYEHTQLVYRPEERTGSKKVVQYVDEPRTRTRKQVEYRDETRTRVKKELSYKQETKTETYPVVNYRKEKRTKEVSYTVQIPEVQAEPYNSVRFEQVAEDVVEEYSIKVPVQSYREVQVQVAKMVPKLVPVTIQTAAPASVCTTTSHVHVLNGSEGCGVSACHGASASFPFIQGGCQIHAPQQGWLQPSCGCR